MNLANKLTVSRLFLSLIIIIILIFPFHLIDFSFQNYFINEKVIVNLKYIIAGIIFIIASLTDFFDGYVARKYKMVTDFGKFLDSIADKILVNSVLIILSAQGFISPVIPVIVISRDILVDSIRMIASNNGKVIPAGKSGKVKAALLMIGIVLTLFYNLPFQLYNLNVSNVVLLLATVLCIYSGLEYYYLNKKTLFSNK